jgi:cell division protein FtsB
MGFFDDLKVPVNPDYDWNVDPHEQLEYVNPVVLNNREIYWANAAVRLTQKQVGITRKLADLKARIQRTEDELHDLEEDLLIQNPPPSSARQSTRLTDLYIRTLAFGSAQAAAYKRLRAEVRQLREEQALLQTALDNVKQVFAMLKLLGEHAMTHLSYVKAESKASRSYT